MTLLPEVRAAIVKAVPEIEQRQNGWPISERSVLVPIRLADVLRAIDGKRVFSVYTGGQLWVDGHYSMVRWNLAADSLDDQSEETIAFLHSVLCADKKV